MLASSILVRLARSRGLGATATTLFALGAVVLPCLHQTFHDYPHAHGRPLQRISPFDRQGSFLTHSHDGHTHTHGPIQAAPARPARPAAAPTVAVDEQTGGARHGQGSLEHGSIAFFGSALTVTFLVHATLLPAPLPAPSAPHVTPTLLTSRQPRAPPATRCPRSS